MLNKLLNEKALDLDRISNKVLKSLRLEITEGLAQGIHIALVYRLLLD